MGASLPYPLVAYFTLALLALIGVGTWFYHIQRLSVQREIAANLETVAQLKVDQVNQWRNERVADALQLMESPFLMDAITNWLEKPNPRMTADLLVRFRASAVHSHYRDVLLTDTNGHVLLSLGRARAPLQAATAQLLAASLRDRKPLLSDLQSAPADLSPHLDVIAPLIMNHADPEKPSGTIILRCDADRSLYPLIQTWPLHSSSAEILLVRREGSAVLFLNPTRFQGDAALKLRIPLTQTNVTSVRAALGETGFAQGADYRGRKVLSVAKAVPDSAWLIVAKMDENEALAPWRSRMATMFTAAVALIAAAALVVGFVWWQKTKFHRYSRSLIEASLDPMVTINREGKITDVNAATEAATGVNRKELIGTDFCGYFSDPAKARSGYEQAFRDGSVRDFSLELRRGDGRTAPVLYNASVYKDRLNKVLGVFAAAHDITKLKEAEAILKTERQRVLDVLETLPAMICLLTQDYRVAFANRSFRNRFGEANGRRCYEYCYGQTAPCSFCQSFTVLDTHRAHHWELNSPDGHVLDVYDFPFTDPDGTPMILEMDVDITERKRTEEALARSNADLLQFNQLAIGRELRMIELKKLINQLSVQLGYAAPYSNDLLREDFSSAGLSEPTFSSDHAIHSAQPLPPKI